MKKEGKRALCANAGGSATKKVGAAFEYQTDTAQGTRGPRAAKLARLIIDGKGIVLSLFLCRCKSTFYLKKTKIIQKKETTKAELRHTNTTRLVDGERWVCHRAAKQGGQTSNGACVFSS